MQAHTVATLLAATLVGCASDPPVETGEWPCGSIETGGYYGLANVHARYQYDDLDNVVWRQETSYEDTLSYGQVLRTETKIFDGRIAVFEELVADDYHHKATRELADGRIVRETYTNYYDTQEEVSTTEWTYAGDRLTRIDRDAVTFDWPESYSEFTYPDDDTRVERACNEADGAEDCSIHTLVGGVDTWTASRTDDDEDGLDDSEIVRVLDSNGLPVLIERYYLSNGTRTYQTNRTEIIRRADGAPLWADNGFTQIEYLFECDAD